MIRILEVTRSDKPMAKIILKDKDAEYTTVKSVEEIPDGMFDVVFSFSEIQQHEAHNVAEVVDTLLKHLKPMGEIHIYTPSVDYAVSLLEYGGDPMLASWIIWGNSEYPHRCGLTLQLLRSVMEEYNVVTRKASQFAYLLPFNNGEQKKAVYNFYMGVKVE